LTWIREVSLKRRWPNRIIVNIEEQVPVAVWNGEQFLNDAAGVFKHGYIDQAELLPRLSGPAGAEREVLAQFMVWQDWMRRTGLQLAAIRLDERRSWILLTTDGIAISLGKEQVEARLQRFLRAFPRYLQSRAGEMHAVDLRYSNGFAVSWNNPPANDTVVKRNRDV
jgi:cell division protein FtsQ